MSHDDFIRRTVELMRVTNTKPLARGWLHSLATRDLSLRGAWGAAVLLSKLPEHEFEPSAAFHPTNCGVCGLTADVSEVAEEDLAERGYGYHVSAVDRAAADVAGASARIEAAPLSNDAGRGLLEGMLDVIAALPEPAQLTELNSSLIGTFKSNKFERMRVLEQLGCAGILPVADHPSYATEWIRWDDANSRQPSEFFKREWAYPVRFWTGSDGVDRDAVRTMFGEAA